MSTRISGSEDEVSCVFLQAWRSRSVAGVG